MLLLLNPGIFYQLTPIPDCTKMLCFGAIEEEKILKHIPISILHNIPHSYHPIESEMPSNDIFRSIAPTILFSIHVDL